MLQYMLDVYDLQYFLILLDSPLSYTTTYTEEVHRIH